MEFMRIPTGTLKRDELYSFIGAIFFAASLILCLSANPTASNYIDKGMPSNVAYILIILASFFLIYSFNDLLNLIATYFANKNATKKAENGLIDDLKKEVGITTETSFHDVNSYEDMFYERYLKSTMIVTLLLSTCPIIGFVIQKTGCCVQDCYYILLIMGFLLVTIVYLSQRYWSLTKHVYKIHILRIYNIIDMYDYKKYAEQRAINYAEYRAKYFKNPDAKNP